jgi:hypothetical protein
MAVQGYLARVKVSGTATAMTDEPTTATGNISYQITNAAKRVLTLETIVVEDGGVPTVEDYTIDRLNGIILFESAVARVITVTGNYFPMSVAAEANEFSLNLSANNNDVTRFIDDGYIRREQGLKSADGSISEFYLVDAYFANKLISGDPVVLELYPDGTEKISLFALLNSDEIASVVDGVVTSSVSFESTKDTYIS